MELMRRETRRRLESFMRQKLRNDLVGWHDSSRSSYVKCPSMLFDTSQIFAFYRHKLASSIRTDEPSIALDFRAVNSIKRFEDVKRAGIFVSNLLHVNRLAPVPFQIHFCNYDRSSEFHAAFSSLIDLDRSLVFESSETYTSRFDKRRLVYLSMSGRAKLADEFDASRVYVIEVNVVTRRDPLQHKALAQARKDGISCQRLPLQDYSE